jgi:hypothetical protein
MNKIRLTLLSSFVLVLFSTSLFIHVFSINAQTDEPCDASEVAAEFAEKLTAVVDISDLKAINEELDAAIKACSGLSLATGTQEDPIPLGEYWQAASGKVRVLSVTDPYTPQDSATAPDAGFRTVAVEVELVCEETGEMGFCFGGSAVLSELLNANGDRVTDASAPSDVQDAPHFDSSMTDQGETLTGFKYFTVDENADVSYFGLFNLGGEGPLEVFFSLTE